jgi:DNA replicative helicase MCM subunit Mcm2 (Cdc46/Mcm family)
MVDKMDDETYVEYHNFISRAYEHCIRLATVLSLFDKKDCVDERDAKCAVGLMYYFIDQRMNLTIDGSIRVDNVVECSKKVHDFLVRKYLNSEITKAVLNNFGPNQYREMSIADRDKVLLELESRDLIDIVRNGTKVSICLKQK